MFYKRNHTKKTLINKDIMLINQQGFNKIKPAAKLQNYLILTTNFTIYFGLKKRGERGMNNYHLHASNYR